MISLFRVIGCVAFLGMWVPVSQAGEDQAGNVEVTQEGHPSDCLPVKKHGLFHRMLGHMHRVSSHVDKKDSVSPENVAKERVTTCAQSLKQPAAVIAEKKKAIEALAIPLSEPLKTYSWYPNRIFGMANKLIFNSRLLFRKHLERQVDFDDKSKAGAGLYVSKSSFDSVKYSYPREDIEGPKNNGVLLVVEVAKGQKVLDVHSERVKAAIKAKLFTNDDIRCLNPNVIIDYPNPKRNRQWLNIKLQDPKAFSVHYANGLDVLGMKTEDLKSLLQLKTQPAGFIRAKKEARKLIEKQHLANPPSRPVLTQLGECISISPKKKVIYLSVPLFDQERCDKSIAFP